MAHLSATAASSRRGLLGGQRSWGWTLVFGILTLLAGVAVLVWPGPTLVLVALIVGVQLVVAGVFQFVRAFATRGLERDGRGPLALLAVLSFLAGIILLRHPFASIAVLALILGLFWILAGVIEIFHGSSERRVPGRVWTLGVGVLSLLAGLAVVIFPGHSLVTLVLIFGIWLVVEGVIEIVAALSMRRAPDRTSATEAPDS